MSIFIAAVVLPKAAAIISSGTMPKPISDFPVFLSDIPRTMDRAAAKLLVQRFIALFENGQGELLSDPLLRQSSKRAPPVRPHFEQLSPSRRKCLWIARRDELPC